MKKLLLRTLALSLTFGLFTACVNDDNYNTPETTLVTTELVTTKTIAEINAAANGTPTLYTADDVIEGYVSSSDEGGNFYKSISFQSALASEPTIIGFSVPVNFTTMFGKGFSTGRKVYIKLEGLYVAKVYGSLQIGSLFEGKIGRIGENVWQNHLFPSATKVNESELLRTLPFSQIFNDNIQNTLVEIDGVQFADGSLGRTYYDVDSGGGSTNHTIIPTTGGGSQVLRVSSFAPFSGNNVPSGSGNIRGVLTKYASTFQFMVRYEDDIMLNDARFDPNPSIGGTAITYPSTLNENFESFAVSSAGTAFPSYINDAFVGSRYWDVKSFGNNKYIQMSAFGGSGAYKTYFIVPVTLTAGNKFSFKSKDGFNNGASLKVYYSTNYVPNGNISDATLSNITGSFAIATGTSVGYATNFTNSGNYVIPAGVSGNGFFIFEYTGSATGVTTTMQIDDIVLQP